MELIKKIQVLGISTDFNRCDCCGREGLAKTVTILDLASGVEVHFGTTCASKADKYDTLEALAEAKKQIKEAVNEWEFARDCAWRLMRKHFGIVATESGYKLNATPEQISACESQYYNHMRKPEPRGAFNFVDNLTNYRDG